MGSNDMAETLTDSTSPPPVDSNGLYHMSNCYADLSRDFYYKTPNKMGSKGLQQIISYIQRQWTPMDSIMPVFNLPLFKATED